MAEMTAREQALAQGLDFDLVELISGQENLVEGRRQAGELHEGEINLLGVFAAAARQKLRELHAERTTAVDGFREDIELRTQQLAEQFHARRQQGFQYFIPDHFHLNGYRIYSQPDSLMQAIAFAHDIERLDSGLTSASEAQPMLKISAARTNDRYQVHGYTTPEQGLRTIPVDGWLAPEDMPAFTYLSHPISQPYESTTSSSAQDPSLNIYLGWGVRRHIERVMLTNPDGSVDGAEGFSPQEKFVAIGVPAVALALEALEAEYEQSRLEADLDELRAHLLG